MSYWVYCKLGILNGHFSMFQIHWGSIGRLWNPNSLNWGCSATLCSITVVLKRLLGTNVNTMLVMSRSGNMYSGAVIIIQLVSPAWNIYFDSVVVVHEFHRNDFLIIHYFSMLTWCKELRGGQLMTWYCCVKDSYIRLWLVSSSQPHCWGPWDGEIQWPETLSNIANSNPIMVLYCSSW